MDVKKLIEETLYALGNNHSLTEVSSKINIIVRLLGNKELQSWYNCEFVNGYTDEELPSYRKSMAADIKADYYVQNGFQIICVPEQSVPVAILGPEKYRKIMTVELKDNIASILGYKDNIDSISMSLNPYERTLVQNVLGQVQIQSVRKIISPASLQTIIDNVQNKIIDLFMDLDEKFFNGELDMTSRSTKEQMQQVIIQNLNAGIVQTGTGTIDAYSSTIAANVTNPLSNDLVSKLSSMIDEIEKQLDSNDEEHNEIAQEIVDIRSQLTESHPNKSLIKRSLKAIAWTASVSCKTAIEELAKKGIEILF